MSAINHSEAVAETIGHLAARWERPDKSILRAVFPLLASGEPVTVERIARITGADGADIETALRLGRAERDGEGKVTELFGITTVPTTHRIEIDGAVLYSCCALVAQMVPMLVNKPARIMTTDPISGKQVRVELSPTRLGRIDPYDARASLVRTEPKAVRRNVGEAFCSHIFNFASHEAAEKFIQRDKRRYTLDMETFHNAARQLARVVWGD